MSTKIEPAEGWPAVPFDLIGKYIEMVEQCMSRAEPSPFAKVVLRGDEDLDAARSGSEYLPQSFQSTLADWKVIGA